jgi:hypothetical protein
MSVTELHIGVILVHKDRLVQIVRIDKGPKIIVRDLVNNTQNVAFHSTNREIFLVRIVCASSRRDQTRMKQWPARYRTHFWPGKLGY